MLVAKWLRDNKAGRGRMGCQSLTTFQHGETLWEKSNKLWSCVGVFLEQLTQRKGEQDRNISGTERC